MGYVYGILFTIISLGFFIHERVNSSIYDSGIKQVFKFIFSLSTGWLLVILLSGNNIYPPKNVILEIILFTTLYIFPITFFIGFEMLLYDKFKSERYQYLISFKYF